MKCKNCENIQVQIVERNDQEAPVHSVEKPESKPKEVKVKGGIQVTVLSEDKESSYLPKRVDVESFDDLKVDPVNEPLSIEYAKQDEDYPSIDFDQQLRELKAKELETEDTCEEDECAKDEREAVCTNADEVVQGECKPYVLPPSWLKAKAYKSMQLFGRVGHKLARLIGPGFLYIDRKGMVTAIKSMKLTVSTLFNYYYRINSGEIVVGDPQKAPYLVVADGDYNTHAIKGGQDESMLLWDPVTQTYCHVPVANFSNCANSQLGKSDTLELVGFDPVPLGGDPSNTRKLKTLSGSGLLQIKEVSTATKTYYTDECDGEPIEVAQTTCVVEVLDVDTTKDCLIGSMNGIVGCHSLDDIKSMIIDEIVESGELQGEQGVPGNDGIDGLSIQGPAGIGVQGPKGERGESLCN